MLAGVGSKEDKEQACRPLTISRHSRTLIIEVLGADLSDHTCIHFLQNRGNSESWASRELPTS